MRGIVNDKWATKQREAILLKLKRTLEPQKKPMMHMCFIGNPGVGKSSIAKVFAQVSASTTTCHRSLVWLLGCHFIACSHSLTLLHRSQSHALPTITHWHCCIAYYLSLALLHCLQSPTGTAALPTISHWQRSRHSKIWTFSAPQSQPSKSVQATTLNLRILLLHLNVCCLLQNLSSLLHSNVFSHATSPFHFVCQSCPLHNSLCQSVRHCSAKALRADLVAGFVGQTEEKVKAAVEEAKGGILIIDEVLSLSGSLALVVMMRSNEFKTSRSIRMLIL